MKLSTPKRIANMLICWPIEALAAMWGLDILEHYGFKVPTPGYFACFAVSFAISLLWAAANLSTEVRKELEAE